ncbi:MAG: efflux RND transporter periplasmic adaptor subunit [Pseudomonadales bacterium]|nr:efflux RND transporter periplasmic adaptor subunit [Pseudomonadales bacterium]
MKIYFFGLLLVLLSAGCQDRTPPTPESQVVRPAKLFEVKDARRAIHHRFVGRVEARQVVDVSFEVAGPLVELPIREGQEIKVGDLLASLDARDFELAIKEAEVQVKIAAQDLQRKQKVLAQKGIARSAVDDARSVYELQLVRLEKAQERLEDSRIVAPFDAYVAERYVDNHVNIERGTKIARLLDLGQVLVVGNVPEALAATGNQEQIISIHAEFDFLPNEQFPLSLYENKGEADSVAQTYEISLIMERPESWNILPGMSATIYVELKDPSTTVQTFVPANSLVSAPDKSFFVWVFNQETQEVSKRSVQVGVPETQGVPVISGLSDGEYIVTTGASQLQPGMRVRPFQDQS